MATFKVTVIAGVMKQEDKTAVVAIIRSRNMQATKFGKNYDLQLRRDGNYNVSIREQGNFGIPGFKKSIHASFKLEEL